MGCGSWKPPGPPSSPLAGSPSREGPELWVPSAPSCLVLLGSVVFVLMSASLSVPPGVAVTMARACHTGTSARGLKVQQEATARTGWPRPGWASGSPSGYAQCFDPRSVLWVRMPGKAREAAPDARDMCPPPAPRSEEKAAGDLSYLGSSQKNPGGLWVSGALGGRPMGSRGGDCSVWPAPVPRGPRDPQECGMRCCILVCS